MNPTGKQIKAVLSRLPKPFYDLDFIRELHEELKLEPTPKGGYLAREKLIKCVKLKMVKETVEGLNVNHSIKDETGKVSKMATIKRTYEYISN